MINDFCFFIITYSKAHSHQIDFELYYVNNIEIYFVDRRYHTNKCSKSRYSDEKKSRYLNRLSPSLLNQDRNRSSDDKTLILYDRKKNALYATKRIINQLIIIEKIEMFSKHDYESVLTIVFNALFINQMKIKNNVYFNT